MTTSLQDEELTALRAIYDDDFQAREGARTSFSIKIRNEDDTLTMTLIVWLPEDYPTHSPPVYEIKSELRSEEDDECVADNLKTIYRDNEGEVVIYQWVEWLRDFLNKKAVSKRYSETSSTEHVQVAANEERLLSLAELDLTKENKAQRHLLPSTTSTTTTTSEARQELERPVEVKIVHGDPFTDRKSTFQAHVATVHSAKEVMVMMTQLKSNKKIASASHNILAYRLYVGPSRVLQQDCDDDGEAAAGCRLLHLLQIMNAQNVAVVVTRWFGGILLHADRFKHINNVARILIQESAIGLQEKHSHPEKQKNSSKKKKSKSRN